MSRLECCVCLDSLEANSNNYVSRCGHILHYNCWINILAKPAACCPQCRKNVSVSELVKVYLTLGNNGEDTEILKNEMYQLRIDLACKDREYNSLKTAFETQKKTATEALHKCAEYRLKIEDLKKVSEAVDPNLLQEAKTAVETTLKKYSDQTELLKKAEADLVNAKKVETDLREKVKMVQVELNRTRQISNNLNRTRSETEMIRKYQGVVEGLKKCAHEYEEMKKCKLLTKKLKIYTDDVDASADLKKDVKKDPEKYVEMFQEVRKFWAMMKKKEDEVKNSPKGCVIHLTNIPPNRKDVTKPVLSQRIAYYNGKVAYITFKPGDREAFVRLEAGAKGTNPAEEVVAKLNDGKLRIKNFVADAKALQGEEEINFLRRSFEDRDKKVKKFQPDFEYLDDTAEVGMLDYMMSLVLNT